VAIILANQEVAVYLRVSSKDHDTRNQEPDLKRWAQSQDKPVKW
jgi:DNA invertase Pin-like site-specific DNA recombinase